MVDFAFFVTLSTMSAPRKVTAYGYLPRYLSHFIPRGNTKFYEMSIAENRCKIS